MGKIKKLFTVVGLILKQPSLLNKILDDENVNKKIVAEKLNLPQGHPSVDIAELVPDFDEIVEPFAFLEGGSMPIEIALLKALAKRFEKCNYLEIGTWRGESVANLASVAEHCVTINLTDDDMRRIGMTEKYIGLHRFFSKELKNVEHISCNSKTFDFSSLNKKFDLVYIDGDHHYDSVLNDTKNAFKLLRDENSIIVWHDYGDAIDNIRWDIVRGIAEGTPSEKRKNIYRISNTRSAIYTTQKVKTALVEYPQTPNKHFKVRITGVNSQ